MLTLEKLLAGIFLEKCLMHDRACQVVNHQANHRFDLLFRVPSIVGNGCILSH